MDKLVEKAVIRSITTIPDTIARLTEGEITCPGQTTITTTETGNVKWSANGREKERDAEMTVKSIDTLHLARLLSNWFVSRDREKEREKEKRYRSSRSPSTSSRRRSRSPRAARAASRSPPRRRARALPRYVMQIPKISLDS